MVTPEVRDFFVSQTGKLCHGSAAAHVLNEYCEELVEVTLQDGRKALIKRIDAFDYETKKDN
jgi:hypothetical protein